MTICSTEWAVEWNGINSVEIVGGNVLNVTNSDLSFTHRLKYRVDFGDENQFRGCTCSDYQPNRMLCKQFFLLPLTIQNQISIIYQNYI